MNKIQKCSFDCFVNQPWLQITALTPLNITLNEVSIKSISNYIPKHWPHCKWPYAINNNTTIVEEEQTKMQKRKVKSVLIGSFLVYRTRTVMDLCTIPSLIFLLSCAFAFAFAFTAVWVVVSNGQCPFFYLWLWRSSMSYSSHSNFQVNET